MRWTILIIFTTLINYYILLPTPVRATAFVRQKTNTFVLGDHQVELQIKNDGRFVSLYDGSAKEYLVEDWLEGGESWKLRYQGGREFSNLDLMPTEVKIENEERKLVFNWEKESDFQLETSIEFDPTTREFWFSYRITNRSPWQIAFFSYPHGLSFRQDNEGYIVLPQTVGKLAKFADFGSLKYPSWVTADPHELNGVYPADVEMQWIGVKNKKTSALIYADDTQGFTKRFNTRLVNDQIVLTVSDAIWIKSNESYQPYYKYRLRIIPHGTYQTMAQVYASWGRKQWWFESWEEKLATRPKIRRYQEGIIRFIGNPTEQIDFSHILAGMDFFEQTYGIKPGYWLTQWWGTRQDTNYPDYFPLPPSMGDLASFNRQLNMKGRTVAYHLNTIHYPDKNCPQTALKKLKPCQSLPSFNASSMAAWQGELQRVPTNWAGFAHYFTSPRLTLSTELATLDRLVRLGATGFYFDVLGHNLILDDNPLAYDPAIDQIGRNNYLQAKLTQLKKFRQNYPNSFIMTEGRNEMLLPYVDLSFGGGIWPLPLNVAQTEIVSPEFLPLWQMVYGDAQMLQLFLKGWPDEVWFHGLSALAGAIPSYPAQYAVKWPYFKDNLKNLTFRQKILAPIIGKKLTRYRREGNLRISEWNDPTRSKDKLVVIYNRAKEEFNGTIETILGNLHFNNLPLETLVVLDSHGNFALSGSEREKIDIVKPLLLRLNKKLLLSSTESRIEIAVLDSTINLANMTDQKKKIEVTVQLPTAPRGKFVRQGVKLSDGTWEKDQILPYESPAGTQIKFKATLSAKQSRDYRLTCFVADSVCDGRMNLLDLSFWRGMWAKIDAEANINGDGAVNILDYLSILREWLETNSK